MVESKWIVIELSELGETATRVELESSLLELLGNEIEYFIPIHYEKIGSYTSTSTLFEGYVFIKDGPESREKVSDLRDFRFFTRVLSGDHGKIHTVDAYKIGALKRKLKKSIHKKIEIGTRVKILEGPFSNLSGEVINLEERGKRAIVRVKRLSRDMLVPVPSTSVLPLDSSETE